MRHTTAHAGLGVYAFVSVLPISLLCYHAFCLHAQPRCRVCTGAGNPLPYEEVRAHTKEAVLAASEAVYQAAPSVCCCSEL